MENENGIKVAVELRRLADAIVGGLITDREAADEMRNRADRLDSTVVELPTDARGNVWHVGDEFVNVKSEGKDAGVTHKIRRLAIDRNGNWYAVCGDGKWFRADDMRRVPQDAIGKTIADMKYAIENEEVAYPETIQEWVDWLGDALKAIEK